ncbi:M48 family metalloprotease [Aestuariivivens insulae]|uniref:M48 family metalloprotease n=1 Tax=Aestuariivivens insulae TaxID=1621988 RepID=UPI001F5A001A|nr:M48 family metalloprotease [Aestuariivivens insulae]
MRLRIFYLFIFLSISVASAQTNANEYIPKNLDSIKGYLKAINLKFIDGIDGKFSSKIKKIYKDRDEKVIKAIEDSAYVFNVRIKQNLDVLLRHVYDANPQIHSKDYYFFINNSLVPNAACYGDGMFEINLGLLSRLDSEDELAFVICHEIAHMLLNHSLKGVTKAMLNLYSDETKNKIEEIKRQEYGRTRAALSVIDELNIDILNHSKEVEAQADSLGYILFSNTKYKKPKALTALDKLKKVDDMVFSHPMKLDSVFNFENYPFKAYWLEENSTSLFDIDKEINDFQLVSDSIKTHPEIVFRKEKLIQEFDIISEEKRDQYFKDHLHEIKKDVNIKVVKSTFDLNFLDLAIYHLIERYNNRKIDIEYYHLYMAKVLQRLYEIKKTHEMGKYIPPKSNFSKEKQLNLIRLFLHNLELKEVENLGFAYCDENQPKMLNNKEFEDVYMFFKKINNQ